MRSISFHGEEMRQKVKEIVTTFDEMIKKNTLSISKTRKDRIIFLLTSLKNKLKDPNIHDIAYAIHNDLMELDSHIQYLKKPATQIRLLHGGKA